MAMDAKSVGASSTKQKWMQELIRLKNEIIELRQKADEREMADMVNACNKDKKEDDDEDENQTVNILTQQV